LKRISFGRRLLQKPRHRWKDNIEMDFEDVEREVWTEFIRLSTETNGGMFCKSFWLKLSNAGDLLTS
jgi:hypothetical protein